MSLDKYEGQYDQNMIVVYIVYWKAKIQIKNKMSAQNTVGNVPVCICNFRSAGIHFHISHWAELANAETIRTAIPVDLKKRNENFTAESAVYACIAIFCHCDQLLNLNSHRLQ